MSGARNGSPERSGQSGPLAASDAADFLSQSNPSRPNSETSSSGKRTIGGSYLAAKRRGEQRISDPSLSTVSPPGKTGARITIPLSDPAPEFLDAMDQSSESTSQAIASLEPNLPSYEHDTPLQPPDTLEPASPQIPEAPLFEHYTPLPAPDPEQAIFPFLDTSPSNTTTHKQHPIPPQLLQPTNPLSQSAIPDVVFPPFPATPHSPYWPTRSAPNSNSEAFFSNIKPYSLSASTLVDPRAVAHFGLERITQVLPASTDDLTPPFAETQQPTPTSQYISAKSLIDPAGLVPSTPNPTLNNPDVADLPTVQVTIIPRFLPKVPRPISPIKLIEHPIDYSYPKAERRSASSSLKKPKRDSRIVTALIDTLAWTTGPFMKPLAAWSLRRRISRLEPQDKAIVEAFTHPQPSQPPPDTPSPHQTVSMEHPPYPLPGEPLTTERAQALASALPLFANTTVFRRSNNTDGFVGYSEGQNTSVKVELTDTMDIIGSARFEDGSGVDVFIANPLDITYPHETRLVFGIKPENRDEALFSLNANQSERKVLHQVALHIARIATTTLQQRKVSHAVHQQLSYIFLSAVANAWDEEVPLSEPAITSLDESGWGQIKTLQQTLTPDTASTFIAYFDIYDTAQHKKEITASETDLLNSSDGDLRIDSFLTSPSSQTLEGNLFYILPKQGPPRIVGTDLFEENEQALVAALRKRSLAFLSALASSQEPHRQRRRGEERTPLHRMNEITARLQKFVLQYTPEGLPNEAIMLRKQ